jgi:polyketide synthase 5
VPVGVRRLRAYESARNARYCYTRIISSDNTGIETDIDVLDRHGNVLLVVRQIPRAATTFIIPRS